MTFSTDRTPGTTCTLTVNWWDGPAPEKGDLVRTCAGSAYLILDVRLTRDGRVKALICERLPHGSVEPGRGVWEWEWAPRRRRPNRS